MQVNPFTINVPNEVLNDLSRRLENVRWPDEIPHQTGITAATWTTLKTS